MAGAGFMLTADFHKHVIGNFGRGMDVVHCPLTDHVKRIPNDAWTGVSQVFEGFERIFRRNISFGGVLRGSSNAGTFHKHAKYRIF